MSDEMEHSFSPNWTNGILWEEQLSHEEIAIRDLIVKEYLFDHNWLAACMRAGLNAQLASEYAQRFCKDSYIRKKLRMIEESKVLQPNKQTQEMDEQLERRRIIEALKAEAYNKGPGSSASARVTALKQLALIYGMEAPKKASVDVKAASGVMVVPMIASVENWENAATETQNKLVEETLDGIKQPTDHQSA